MPSPAPCPTPEGCPTPQPCSEVFDAQCVVYTGENLLCDTDVVVSQNDTVAEALESIVDYICTETIVSTDIECDTDVVVESGTTVADALVDIVDYFCNNSPAPGYTYEIGQYVPTQGGVIFHRYKDGGQENYLVVGIQDNSSNVVWDSRSMFTPSIPNTSNLWDGLANTQAIVAGGVPLPNAAVVAQASNLPPSPLQDWYLPAIDELSLLWQNRFNVNKTLSGNSSFGSIIGATQIGYNNYWSSTQINATTAWAIIFVPGSSNYGFYGSGKSGSYYVRAIRKFSI